MLASSALSRACPWRTNLVPVSTALHGGEDIRRLCGDGHPKEGLVRYLIEGSMASVETCVARELDRDISSRGLESESGGMGNSVVAIGRRSGAPECFHMLDQGSAFSWEADISGFTAKGQGGEALKTFYRMIEEGQKPNKPIFISVLKACSSLADLSQGKWIHRELSRRGYGSDAYVVTTLISMYAKCGSISDARAVFDGISHPRVASWNAMIDGYAQQQDGDMAFGLYLQMLKGGCNPDNWTFVGVLKACSSSASMEEGIFINGQIVKPNCLLKGKMIHVEISKRGFALDSYLGPSLIHMYTKCGSMVDAQHVFDMMSQRSVLSWNGMIAGFVQQKQFEKALHLYDQMQEEAVLPNSRVFVSALKACGMLAETVTDTLTEGQLNKVECLQKGKAIHADLVSLGHRSDLFVGNILVRMYAKCGSILDARHVFDTLSERDVVSWNAMIAGYAELEEGEEALHLYARMQTEGVMPDSRTFVFLLKACGSLADMANERPDGGQGVESPSLRQVRSLHAEVIRLGYDSDIFVGSMLVDMYAKCGSMTDAQHFFETLPQRNVVVWNAIIGGYAAQEEGDRALELYAQMKQEGVMPNNWIFVSILRACGSLAELEKGSLLDGRLVKQVSLQRCQDIHAELILKGCESDVFVGTTLVDVYAKCGSMLDARRAFDTLSLRNVVSWSAMIAAYAEQEQGTEALQLYVQMCTEGVMPNTRTFVSVLTACCSLAATEKETIVSGQLMRLKTLEKGKAIHADAIRMGCDSDVYVGNNLIHMYAKCGSLVDARQVFDNLPQRDVVSWNAIIAGYADEQGAEALQIFAQVQQEGGSLNNWMFVSALRACSSLAEREKDTLIKGQSLKLDSLQKGKAIHAEVLRRGYGSNSMVANALVYMYAKCGSIVDALAVFDALGERNVVSWNSMISGYSLQGQGEKAMQLYPQMKAEGIEPTEATFLCILKACSNVGALRMCSQIHRDICRDGQNWTLNVGNALVHAYGKCGNMINARHVFDTLPWRDVVSWNSLIAGYARQGESEIALQCYEEMQDAGIRPDAVTFLCVITACSHAGVVEKGLQFFESMDRDHAISATLQHYASLVDLLSRAGLLKEAEDLILKLPIQSELGMWLSLLGACRKYGNVELGRRAFYHAVALEPEHRASYILMSNIYAHADMLEEATMVEDLRSAAGASKRPGQSWVEHGGNVEVFVAGRNHQQDQQITEKLNQLSAQILEEGCYLL